MINANDYKRARKCANERPITSSYTVEGESIRYRKSAWERVRLKEGERAREGGGGAHVQLLHAVCSPSSPILQRLSPLLLPASVYPCASDTQLSPERTVHAEGGGITAKSPSWNRNTIQDKTYSTRRKPSFFFSAVFPPLLPPCQCIATLFWRNPSEETWGLIFSLGTFWACVLSGGGCRRERSPAQCRLVSWRDFFFFKIRMCISKSPRKSIWKKKKKPKWLNGKILSKVLFFFFLTHSQSHTNKMHAKCLILSVWKCKKLFPSSVSSLFRHCSISLSRALSLPLSLSPLSPCLLWTQ